MSKKKPISKIVKIYDKAQSAFPDGDIHVKQEIPDFTGSGSTATITITIST